MSGVSDAITAVLVYPGVLWITLLSLVIGRLLGAVSTPGRAVQSLREVLSGQGGWLYVVAALLPLIALGWLPWPHPNQAAPPFQPWLLWGLLEASASLMVVRDLMSPDPIVSRAAVREAQRGVSGRLVIWLSMSVVWTVGNRSGTAVTLQETFALATSLIAALLALPAAAGWTPFDHTPFGGPPGYAPGEGPGSDQQAALKALVQRVQSVWWLALVATVFVAFPPLVWWVELVARFSIMVALAIVVNGSRGLFISRTLPDALRWCWWIALPCALLALALASVR